MKAVWAVTFFVFFGHNPLRSPDWQKLMKENESHFPFISLPFLSDSELPGRRVGTPGSSTGLMPQGARESERLESLP